MSFSFMVASNAGGIMEMGDGSMDSMRFVLTWITDRILILLRLFTDPKSRLAAPACQGVQSLYVNAQ